MCGITGMFDTRDQRLADRGILERMNDSQHHRGPDETGIFMAPGVGFGHKRLSIIDLSSGQQPMSSADKNVTVCYNGEIYNFMEIRRQLEDYGYKFRTHSDTEVIIYAWMEWGEACVKQFRGMFAFALYDKRTGTVFLARDRLGVKPLHVAALANGWVLFGSELKSLLAHPEIKRDLDVHAIEDYFTYGYIPDPRTILKAAFKLPAGHTMLMRHGQQIGLPKPYWNLKFAHTHKGSEADLAHEMTERLREAVKIRLMSEVPLGAFLSGGVDSSAVVAMMAGLMNEPVNTCTIGFDVATFDETAYAQQIADRYKTNHSSRTVASNDFSLIDTLVNAYDEPFSDSSALPTYRVCQLARESVTVALSGDGGDELFAGYRRHKMHLQEERVRSVLPLGLRRPFFGFLGRAYPQMDWAPQFLRARSTFQALGMTTAEAYVNSISVMRPQMRQQLMTPAFRREIQGYRSLDHMKKVIESAPADDVMGQIQYADIKIWLPGDILTKADRASMAVGLEAREPLLDHKLLEWAAGLPLNMRIRNGQGKYILKKAMEPYVPNDLLYRPKQGFSVPISSWFRGPLKNTISDMLKTSPMLETGWFDRGFLDKVLDDHSRGIADHGRLLWQVLMFDRSLSRLVGAPSKQLV